MDKITRQVLEDVYFAIKIWRETGKPNLTKFEHIQEDVYDLLHKGPVGVQHP